MAFTPVDGVIALGEELMAAAFKAALDVDIPRPFPRMTYAEAMDRYGCDKPDTRYGLELRDVSAVVRLCQSASSALCLTVQAVSRQVSGCGFRLFADNVADGCAVKAITVPNGSRIKNSALKAKGDVFEQAVGAAGLPLVYARVAVAADGAVTLDAGKAVTEALEGREKALVRAPQLAFTRVLCIC